MRPRRSECRRNIPIARIVFIREIVNDQKSPVQKTPACNSYPSTHENRGLSSGVSILLVPPSCTATTSTGCEEKPISRRPMDDCAAFEHKQADAHLNKVYRKAVQDMTDMLSSLFCNYMYK
jgi:hypothetical protein